MAATESGVVAMSAVADATTAAAATTTATTDDASSGLSYKGMSSDNIKGLVLALSSSLFIGARFIVKKKGLKKTGASGVWAGVGGYSYLYEPLWWIGMITMIVGEIVNFVAYAFAPAILVTPLGALSIIISVVLAHIILREKLHIFGVLGCALYVVGSTTIILHAPHEHEIQSDRVGAHKGADPSMGDGAIPPQDSNIHGNSVANGEEWVELVLTEMKNATSIDDAKARAARVLQNFEKAIYSQSSSGTSQNLQKDNLILKEKLGVVLHENTILKRPVAIQHERHKEFDNKVQNIQHMKQMVTQYQEQVRTLEVWVVLLLWQVLFGP